MFDVIRRSMIYVSDIVIVSTIEYTQLHKVIIKISSINAT